MTVRDILPWRPQSRGLARTGLGDPFMQMRQEMDRLFEDFWPNIRQPLAMRGELIGRGELMPPIDVSETKDGIEVTVDLPGIDPKDVSLTLSEDVLTISGERREESEQRDRSYQRVERSYGSFVRRLAMPFKVDSEHIEANFRNGVLKVLLPKSREAEAEERRIEIKAK